MVDLNVFKRAYIVQGLDEKSLTDLANLGKELDLPNNKELIVAGEISSDLYIVLEGKVIVLTSNGDKLAEVGEGNVLGEMSLIDNQPRSAHVVTLGQVRVLKIAASDIRTYLNQHKDVGFAVMSNLAIVLANRLRKADKTIDHLLNLDPWKHSS